jgi:dTDP-4-amino-4,6-dideoxygalactose transaminase
LSLGLKKGSRIAVPAVSYAATAMAVVNAGHVPVFIDVEPETGLMDLDKLELELELELDCVIPVHLYGQCVDVFRIVKTGVPVIEDCAQAIGARIRDKHVGTIGAIGCFSFYPGKNLGALGDAGACITNDPLLAVSMKEYASLGSPSHNRYNHLTHGINSRMDCFQGLVLSEKLKHIDEWTKERVRIAQRYSSFAPKRSTVGTDVYHVFHILVNDRDSFIEYMKQIGIETNIHYPIPLPHLECFKDYQRDCPVASTFCSQCVSLPLFPGMTEEEITFIISARILDASSSSTSHQVL